MKKILAGMLLFASIRTSACDICGLYLGIQPHDRTSTFGLLYRYRLLEGDLPGSTLLKHGDGGTGATVGSSHYVELYQTLEMRAHLWLGQRWSMLASVPVVNNYQSVDGYMRADVYGLGDPFALMRYVVANTRCLSEEERTVHRLSVGAGAKLPLGATDRVMGDQEVDHDLQPGTGSWDGLASLEYMVRRHELGASLAALARYNGTNADDHRAGHGLSTTAEVFRQFILDLVQWLPSAGAYLEMSTEDRDHGEVVTGTGGSTLFAHVGSRVWWKSWSLTLNYQIAMARSIGALMVPDRDRLVLGITYDVNNI